MGVAAAGRFGLFAAESVQLRGRGAADDRAAAGGIGNTERGGTVLVTEPVEVKGANDPLAAHWCV